MRSALTDIDARSKVGSKMLFSSMMWRRASRQTSRPSVGLLRVLHVYRKFDLSMRRKFLEIIVWRTACNERMSRGVRCEWTRTRRSRGSTSRLMARSEFAQVALATQVIRLKAGEGIDASA